MSKKAVLMYHAVWSDDKDLATIADEDRPYAISVDKLRSQMDWLEDNGKLDETLLTFDDGHASALHHVLPILNERNLTATLFVTTDWVSRRAGFCNLDALRTLKEAGWQIGAHGHTHRFLTELTDDDLEIELRASAEILGDLLGAQPLMSFPGGRYTKREVAAARAAGFVTLFGSRPGAYLARQATIVPRYAIRSEITLSEFAAIANQNVGLRIRHQFGYASKQFLKRIIGDSNYHRLYRLVKA